jgi:hypothetical protein
MATIMLCPSWSVLRLRSNKITNEQTTQLAKRPICPRPPERLGAFVSSFLAAAPLLTGSNIHSLDSFPAVSCNEGFCNAPRSSVPDLDHAHGVAETSPFREWRVPSLIPVAPGY